MKKSIVFILVFVFVFSLQIFAQTWSPPKRLTYHWGPSLNSAIAVDSSNRVHIVWDETCPEMPEIFYKRSSDNGSTWLALQRLTWNLGPSVCPCIAIDSDNRIHIVWANASMALSDYEIYYKCSTDSGSSWSETKRLTWNPDGSNKPSIAVDSGEGIHLVWEDSTAGNKEIYYKRSIDKGVTWSESKRLTWTGGSSKDPSIVADSLGGIHVVWVEDNPWNYLVGIYYRRSTDNGATWLPRQRLTWHPGSAYTPSLAIDLGNRIHMVWANSMSGNSEIFYKCSTDNGNTWSSPIRLTWTPGISLDPSIVASSKSMIHIVWKDTNPGNWEIFYKLSSDSGISWLTPERLTWNLRVSSDPEIIVDSGNGIHVVWSDLLVEGNSEIFYKNRK